MQNKIVYCVLFICCFFFNSYASAKSPVWKISKDGNHLFLGGTVHLLAPTDYPLPSAFQTAYNNSQLLVLEADLQELNTIEFQQKLLKNTVYPGEQDISQFLKPKTMKALHEFLASRGIPTENLIKFKSGMLSITLTVVELQRLGIAGTGVDEFFNLRALNENRKIKHLETVDDQLDFLSKMGEGNEDKLIEHTLKDLKNLPKLMGSLKNAWKDGDTVELKRLAIDPMKNRFPKVYNALLASRNNRWIPKIERMLQTAEVELVLFGALHLVGEDGILKQLEARGYKIENQ